MQYINAVELSYHRKILNEYYINLFSLGLAKPQATVDDWRHEHQSQIKNDGGGKEKSTPLFNT